MSDGTILLRATCRRGHSWDVWADVVDGKVLVDGDDRLCPECDPPVLPGQVPSRAVRYEDPESLA